jgi:hypothetical protein
MEVNDFESESSEEEGPFIPMAGGRDKRGLTVK